MKNGIKLNEDKQQGESFQSIDNDVSEKLVAVDQSYFDKKIQDLFDTSINELKNSTVHSHRFDGYILHPRTKLKDGEVFCKDDNFNDLLLKETTENQALYERLKQEKALRESRQPSSGSGLNFSGLFGRQNLERQFKKQAKTKYIETYQVNNNKLRDMSIAIQVATSIAEKSRNEYNETLTNYFTKNSLNMELMDNPNYLNNLIFNNEDKSDDLNAVIVSIKNQHAAEKLLHDNICAAINAEKNGLFDVTADHMVSELQDSVKSAKLDKLASNLALTTALLEPTQYDAFASSRPLKPKSESTSTPLERNQDGDVNQKNKRSDDVDEHDFSEFIKNLTSKFNNMFSSFMSDDHLNGVTSENNLSM